MRCRPTNRGAGSLPATDRAGTEGSPMLSCSCCRWPFWESADSQGKHLGGRRFPRGRWLWLVPGVLLFLLVFLFAVSCTLPDDVILSLVRPALAKAGFEIAAESARVEFPLGVRLDKASIGRPGGAELRLGTIRAGGGGAGVLRWLPVPATGSKGRAQAEAR